MTFEGDIKGDCYDVRRMQPNLLGLRGEDGFEVVLATLQSLASAAPCVVQVEVLEPGWHHAKVVHATAAGEYDGIYMRTKATFADWIDEDGDYWQSDDLRSVEVLVP